MRKSLLFIVALAGILVTSCGGGDDVIVLGSDKELQLIEGERIISIDQRVLDRYESFFDREHVNAPLYRYVQGPDYDIYLGLLYDQAASEIKRETLAHPDNTVIEISDEGAVRSSSTFGTSCARLVSAGEMEFIVIVVSQKEDVVATHCADSYFQSRIVVK